MDRFSINKSDPGRIPTVLPNETYLKGLILDNSRTDQGRQRLQMLSECGYIERRMNNCYISTVEPESLQFLEKILSNPVPNGGVHGMTYEDGEPWIDIK